MVNFTGSAYLCVNNLRLVSEMVKNYADAFYNVAQGIAILAATYYGYRALRRDDAQAQPSDSSGAGEAGGDGCELLYKK